jgi:outer membrane protein assembly factor BamB
VRWLVGVALFASGLACQQAQQAPAEWPAIRGETERAARAAPADWPMFRNDVERSGFAEGSTVGAHVERVWQIPSFNVTQYGAPKGSPSVAGDLLYCGTDTGLFVAANVKDGAIVWQARFDRTSHGIHGSPAVIGDFVYIGAYDGTVTAFERVTGDLIWQRKIGYQVGSSPAVVETWSLLFSSHEEADGTGDVVALDSGNGALKWRRRTHAHPHSSVAIDVGLARVFVGDNAGQVYAFEAHTGAPLWRRQLTRGDVDEIEVKTTPTVIPELGLVVFGAWSGKVYALDELSGEVKWEQSVGGRLTGSNAYLPATKTLFIGSIAGDLIALDATSGRVLWERDAGAGILSSPAVSGDGRAVVFGASDGRIRALATADGSLIWSAELDGEVSGSPTLVGNRIYVTSRRGSLWALETRDPPRAEGKTP